MWNYRDEFEFLLKVVQMKEILEVRHCMFIIGQIGCGKTAIIDTLVESERSMGKRTELC